MPTSPSAAPRPLRGCDATRPTPKTLRTAPRRRSPSTAGRRRSARRSAPRSSPLPIAAPPTLSAARAPSASSALSWPKRSTLRHASRRASAAASEAAHGTPLWWRCAHCSARCSRRRGRASRHRLASCYGCLRTATGRVPPSRPLGSCEASCATSSSTPTPRWSAPRWRSVAPSPAARCDA